MNSRTRLASLLVSPALALAANAQGACPTETLTYSGLPGGHYGWDAVLLDEYVLGTFISGTASPGLVVHKLQAGAWVLQGIVNQPSIPALDGFGESLAATSSRAYVGAPFANASKDGKVVVFTNAQGAWTHTHTFASPSSKVKSFGIAVAAEGSRVAIGALGDGVNPGVVYVYEELGGIWTGPIAITGNGQFSDFAGTVEWGNGRLYVGERFYQAKGAVHVFDEISPGVWTETQLLVNPSSVSTTFGTAISTNGTQLAVGAPNGTAEEVHVYDLVAGSWVHSATIAPPSQAGPLFGSSVAIEADTLLIGALNASVSGVASGAAFEYHLTAGVWTPSKTHVPSNPANGDKTGTTVGLKSGAILAAAPDKDNLAGSIVVSANPACATAVAGVVNRSYPGGPNSYTATPAILGSSTPVTMTVDLAGTTGHTVALLFGAMASMNLPLSSGGTLLVDVVTPGAPLIQFGVGSGPMPIVTFPVPADPAYCGLTVYTQALHLLGPTPFTLSNAQDLTLAFQ